MTELTFAGVEGGGTTFKVAIAKGTPSNIVESTSFDTNQSTVQHVLEWLRPRKFDALGISCFGPLDLDTSSQTYGYITTTPKLAFQHYNILGAFNEFHCPKEFDTDVNAAVLAEVHGADSGSNISAAYVTVGTGVGVGLVTNGQPVHGVLHPEMGHYYPQRRHGDTFEGVCPFHKHCLEGFVSAPAIAKRAGLTQTQLAELKDDDEIWDQVGYYLAQLCVTLILTISPHRIVLGGGVMKREALFPIIRRHTTALLNGYIAHKRVQEIEKLIVPSQYGDNGGLVGALELARQAQLKSHK
jgi:fructokinase